MKALLIFFLALVSFSFESNAPKYHKFSTQKTEQTVFICKGPNSKKFHAYSSCRGLSNCTTLIFSVNQAEAERIGRIACQICY